MKNGKKKETRKYWKSDDQNQMYIKEVKKREDRQTKISRIIINQTKKCEMINMRKFYENEVTFLLRKIIDITRLAD